MLRLDIFVELINQIRFFVTEDENIENIIILRNFTYVSCDYFIIHGMTPEKSRKVTENFFSLIFSVFLYIKRIERNRNYKKKSCF